jgi:4-hydroxy-tetrahydrodipicolinate reductase
MKIALIGYGKMGHAIERIAQNRGHEIVMRITHENTEDFTSENLKQADVAIEFTSPEAAKANVNFCIDNNVPVVCGTTGWNEHFEEISARVKNEGGSFLQASNFSLGVNIFFEVNKRLAQLMQPQKDYRCSVEEIHHLQKKDAPSGTAITIAEQILENNNRFSEWKLNHGTETMAEPILPIIALREEGVPGTHEITWESEVDKIDIIHTAHSRDGFALGAVVAAEYIAGKKGVFTMRDVLGL